MNTTEKLGLVLLLAIAVVSPLPDDISPLAMLAVVVIWVIGYILLMVGGKSSR